MKVLIAPDKFKGTLTAAMAAQAIARGWSAPRPKDVLEFLPISDGGDGFGAVMSRLLGAKARTAATVDAAHRPCRAAWWWEPKSRTAIIESANVIGLAQLPLGKFHPFELDTFGLGAVMRAAAAAGARRCWIGIGGSATNDGGFGVARALGWRFVNGAGKLIRRWTELESLMEIRLPRRARWFEELVVAVDVQNPLLGPRGCTRIYGPQKGLKREEFAVAERCLRRLAEVMEGLGENIERRTSNVERPMLNLRTRAAGEPGDGAAGGLGFGLRCFAGARLERGFELFARQAELDRRLREVDLVITGEGAIDASTLMGKGVGQIALECHKLGIPCVGLAGTLAPGRARRRKYFARLHGLMELTSAAEAKRRAAFWLERLAGQAALEWRDAKQARLAAR